MQEKNPHRKQIRLKEYDYSQEGYYFITICTKDRKEILGKIENNNKSNANIVGAGLVSARKRTIINKPNANVVGADDPVRPQKTQEHIKLTQIGRLVEECWKQIDKIYDNIEIGDYVIMPNHIHGIIIINGRTESSAPTIF